MANELVLCFVPDPERCLGRRTVTRRKYQLTRDNGACTRCLFGNQLKLSWKRFILSPARCPIF